MNDTQTRINDFVLKIATVNGTGSASTNGLLMKALFRMGIPVTGKNLFPSNIQGLPTWYEVRASDKGYMSRCARVDIMVAMNVRREIVLPGTNMLLILKPFILEENRYERHYRKKYITP